MVDERGCWIWLRSFNNQGYGLKWSTERRRLDTAHRWMYEQVTGLIPSGFQIDHLYTPDNTLWQKNGTRKCRACRAAATKRYEQRRQDRKQQPEPS